MIWNNPRTQVMETKEIDIGNFKIGGDNPLFLIAGPCVIENEKIPIYTAEEIKVLEGLEGVRSIWFTTYLSR